MSLGPGYEVDWNLVRTFVSVVEAGSLSGAARTLDLSHPTVARHVQQLEAQLGLPLFERGARGLVLNESGQRLAEVADRMRREAMTLESVGESVRSTTAGRVRVTIAEVFADMIPELLRPLQEQPGVAGRHIELIVSRERLNLLDREADLAVRHVRPEQGELICRKVGVLRMGAWASESYVAAHGQPTFDTLDRHRFIDGLTRRALVLALERLGYGVPVAQVAFRTDCLESQRRAAELGWGIVGIPDYLAKRSRGLVRVLDPVPDSVHLPIWLAARPAVRHRQLLKMVFDALANGLCERFGPDVGTDQGPSRDASALTA